MSFIDEIDYDADSNDALRSINARLEQEINDRNRIAAELKRNNEHMQEELRMAAEFQNAVLPAIMDVPYVKTSLIYHPLHGVSGDVYDFILNREKELSIFLGDATGHGIGPALSATQVRAMLRVALRLGADLDQAFKHINDQLVDDLPDDRFVTAFFGQLNATTHKVLFHSGGQGPIMLFRAESREYHWYEPSTFPLGYMNQENLDDAITIEMEPGDILGLISDGIYEYENEAGEQFGQAGLVKIIDAHQDGSVDALVQQIMQATYQHGGTVPQADDMTIVLIKRLP